MSKEKVSLGTSVSPQQLEKFLSISIPNLIPVMITGRPGIGKSDIVAAASKKAGFHLQIAHLVTYDPTDLRGMPWVKEGKADFILFSDIEKIVDTDEKIVFFMDDFGQSSPMVQAMAMQWVLARESNGRKVGDNVVFIVATNRRDDLAAVSGILEPVKSRFSILNLEPDLDSWLAWAYTQEHIPAILLAAVRFRPTWITDWEANHEIENAPNPRNIAETGKLISLDINGDLRLPAFASRLGNAAAIELVSFIELANELPKVEEIIKNPKRAPVPDRPDSLYALVGALVAKTDDVKNLPSLFTYVERIPVEYAVYFVKDSVGKNPNISKTKDFVDWTSENSEYFEG